LTGLHVVATTAPSPTPTRETPPTAAARRALADAIEARERARAVIDAAQRPVTIGEALVAAADRAEAELDRLRAERKRLTGQWLLAGGEGERPASSKDETLAEHLARRARADAEAAAGELAPAMKARDDALGALRQAAERREVAVGAVLADEVSAALLAEMGAAIELQLKAEAKLRGLCTILREHEGVAGMAEGIEAGIRRVKAEAGVPHRVEWARSYWGGLSADAAHEEQ
jgi:hypothetical protein